MENKTCGECRYFKQEEEICSHNQKHYWSKAEFEACTGFEPKVITNGDVIRKMGNEKLAELFDNSCKVCAKDIVECDTDCVAGILAWLNAPAKEGEDE